MRIPARCLTAFSRLRSRSRSTTQAALTHDVAFESRRLSLSTEDPADRFLAATAKVYDLTLVTADERLLALREIKVLSNR